MQVNIDIAGRRRISQSYDQPYRSTHAARIMELVSEHLPVLRLMGMVLITVDDQNVTYIIHKEI